LPAKTNTPTQTKPRKPLANVAMIFSTICQKKAHTSVTMAAFLSKNTACTIATKHTINMMRVATTQITDADTESVKSIDDH
jgi:hypothetical protein